MYALPNKTQHKLIAKVRGGINQKLDNFNSTNSSSSSSSSASSTTTTKTTTSTNSDYSCSPLLSSSTASPFNLFNSKESPTFATSADGVAKSSSSSPLGKFARHIDEAGFRNDLDCLPQPVFQHSNSSKQKLYSNKAQKQCITPEHNEMIKYVQQSWKGVERDYKKSVNSYLNTINLTGSSSSTSSSSNQANDHQELNNHQMSYKQKHGNGGAKKKTATTSTPLLLTGSYHHTSVVKDSSGSNRQDSFRPFDLEAFWGNRILKRLTQDTL